MKRTRCQHPRLKSFTFSSGEVMSLCPDCSFGEVHTDSRYTKRRGPKEPQPEQDEIETEFEPELEELTETGLPAFSVLDDENDALSVIESDAESDSDKNADEEAEVLEEIEESA